MKHITTFENFAKNDSTESAPVTEAVNIGVTDTYGKDIWNKYNKDITDLVAKINKQFFDGDSSEIICDALSQIFEKLSEVDEPLRKQMNPNN